MWPLPSSSISARSPRGSGGRSRFESTTVPAIAGAPIARNVGVLPRNRLPQNLPRGLRAVELTQRAASDLPALRRAHDLPAVRRHAMDPEALGAAVVGDIDGIALRLRHQDLQIGRHDGGVALDRDMGQGGEMRKPAFDRRLVVGAERVTGDQVVDLEPVFDGVDSVFEALVGRHGLLPYSRGGWRVANSE